MYDELQRQLKTSPDDPDLLQRMMREARRRNDVGLFRELARRRHGCACETCLLPMLLELADDADAEGFSLLVGRMLEGVLEEHRPQRFALVKIDNWFSAKWQGFTGVTAHRGLIAGRGTPPFRENRIRGECRFVWREDAYVEAEAPKRKRKKKRSASQSLDADVAYIWYSGNTSHNRRGCVMCYVPFPEPDFMSTTHWMAYIELEEQAGGAWNFLSSPSVPEAQVLRWVAASPGSPSASSASASASASASGQQ